MKLMYLSFTERGERLAKSLAAELGGVAERCGEAVSLAEWTKKGFSEADGLVFVGAAGIAVRAIAPICVTRGSIPLWLWWRSKGDLPFPFFPDIWEVQTLLRKKSAKAVVQYR